MDLWTLLVLAAIGLAAAGWFWRQKEAAVVSIGPLLDELGSEYRGVVGVDLNTPKGMIRIDRVVVSPYGLFIIHERPEKGQVDVQPGNREWPITLWRKRDTLYNPLWRNRQAINDLGTKLGEMPMIPIVVFLNARLKGPEEPALVRPQDVLRRIRSFKRQVLNEEEQKKALAFLR